MTNNQLLSKPSPPPLRFGTTHLQGTPPATPPVTSGGLLSPNDPALPGGRYHVPFEIASDLTVMSSLTHLKALDNLKLRLIQYSPTITKVIADGSFESTTMIYGKPFRDLHTEANGAIGTATSSLDAKRTEAVTSLSGPITVAEANFSSAKTTAMAAYNERKKAEAEKAKASSKGGK